MSKLLWGVAAPGNALLLLLCLGVILLAAGVQRIGGWVVGIATVTMLGIAVLPVSDWLARPLENRFARPTLPARVDGVIVLGGSVDQRISADRRDPVLNDAAERLTTFAALARRYPDAKLVFSGGSGRLTMQELKESDASRALLEAIGLDGARVVWEDQSRNTFENVRFSRDLVRPSPGETWVVVTSAMHMPRAVGLFEAAGWPVIPYPTDYRTAATAPLLDFDLQSNLGVVDSAVKEWLGLAAYRLMGRTADLFPGPSP